MDWRSADERLVSDRRPRLPARGRRPEGQVRTDDYIAAQALVAAGLGVAVVPGLAVTHPLPGLQVRAIRGAPVRQISAVRPHDGYRGPAVGSMLDSLRTAAETLTITAQQHDAR